MTTPNRERARRLREIMDADGEAVNEMSTQSNRMRYYAIESFDEWDSLRSRARTIEADAVDRLPELIEGVRGAVAENGGSVYLAEDAADANAHVTDVCADVDADSVVKSKSMTTEELDLNDHLEAAGVDVWETDLGEFVVQLAGESPSHLVGPAMHKTREEIADLFAERFDLDEPLETAAELTAFASEYLEERILAADVGVTGANFVLAESGSIVLVTNEGNARKCAVTPDVHVAVAGVDKLLPSIEELHPFSQLIARAATGQSVPQYLSVLTPPVDTPTMDYEADVFGARDRSFHLILVDNGRLALREDDSLRETLYCIRCGACSNACANFQQVGGHAFGGETYTGGIAAGWEAAVHGYDSAATFTDLCTGCTRCVEACPVGIDVPWINTVVRDRLNRGGDPTAFDHLVDGLAPDVEESGVPLGRRVFGNVDTLAKIGSATMPVSNWIARRRPVRVVLERLAGVDRRRDLPTFASEPFTTWFDRRGGPEESRRRATIAADARSMPDAGADGVSVVVYPDTYTNYVAPARGRATVTALESMGIPVRVPSIGDSGRPALSQGLVATARERAEAVADALDPHLSNGASIAVIEPSDHAMFVREYERLLAEPTARRIREASADVLGVVGDRLDRPGVLDALPTIEADPVTYHPHCQGRTIDTDREAVETLERLGFDVTTTDAECCGMAGSFGYKRAYYELSVRVGDALADEIDEESTVLASGVSCGEQLEDRLQRPVYHPIELVASIVGFRG